MCRCRITSLFHYLLCRHLVCFAIIASSDIYVGCSAFSLCANGLHAWLCRDRKVNMFHLTVLCLSDVVVIRLLAVSVILSYLINRHIPWLETVM